MAQRPRELALLQRSAPARWVWALLWACVLMAAPRAEATMRLVVVSFKYAATDGEQLSDSVALELELEEDLLLVPSEDVLLAFNSAVGDATPDEVARVLQGSDVDLLLRAESVEGYPERALLWLLRKSDGAPVWQKPVLVEDALADIPELAGEISRACAEAEALPRLSDNAQQAARLLARPTDETPPEPTPTAPAKASAPDDKSAGEGNAPDDDVGPAPPSALAGDGSNKPDTGADQTDAGEANTSVFDKNALRTRAVGLSLFYSASLLRYRACNPARSSPVGFLCQPKSEVDEVVNILPALVGGGAHLEVYPWIPYVGLHVDGRGSLATARLSAKDAAGQPLYTVDSGNGPSRTDSILVWNVQGTAAVVGRMYLEFGFLALALGARIGVHGGYRGVPLHYIIDADGSARNVTLMPTMARGAFAPGLHAGLGLGRWARAIVDVDALGGIQCEPGSTVATARVLNICLPAVGARGRAQVDVDVAFGFLLSGYTEMTFFSATGTGEGTRLTFNLEPYESGAVDVLDAAAGFGVGYRF